MGKHIVLVKRVKYAGDVHARLLEAGWDMENATLFVEGIQDADVAPVVHGRWEEWWPPKHMILTGEEMLWRCSACDAKFSDQENVKECMRYCPRCGARMDGE